MEHMDLIIQNLQFDRNCSLYGVYCAVRRQFYAFLGAELCKRLWDVWLTDLGLLRPEVSARGNTVFLLTQDALRAGYVLLGEQTAPDGSKHSVQLLTAKGLAFIRNRLSDLAEIIEKMDEDREKPQVSAERLENLRRKLRYRRDLSTRACWTKLNALLREELGQRLPQKLWYDWLYDMSLLSRGRGVQAKRGVVTYADPWAIREGYIVLVQQKQKPAGLERPRMVRLLTQKGQEYVASQLDRLLERLNQTERE